MKTTSPKGFMLSKRIEVYLELIFLAYNLKSKICCRDMANYIVRKLEVKK